jgi:hypothetical protein
MKMNFPAIIVRTEDEPTRAEVVRRARHGGRRADDGRRTSDRLDPEALAGVVPAG